MSIYKQVKCSQCGEDINIYIHTKLYVRSEIAHDIMCEDCKIAQMSRVLADNLEKGLSREDFFKMVSWQVEDYLIYDKIKIDIYLKNGIVYYTGDLIGKTKAIRVFDEGDIDED